MAWRYLGPSTRVGSPQTPRAFTPLRASPGLLLLSPILISSPLPSQAIFKYVTLNATCAGGETCSRCLARGCVIYSCSDQSSSDTSTNLNLCAPDGISRKELVILPGYGNAYVRPCCSAASFPSLAHVALEGLILDMLVQLCLLVLQPFRCVKYDGMSIKKCDRSSAVGRIVGGTLMVAFGSAFFCGPCAACQCIPHKEFLGRVSGLMSMPPHFILVSGVASVNASVDVSVKAAWHVR